LLLSVTSTAAIGTGHASTDEFQFRARQGADDLPVEAQGLRFAEVAGASRLFGGLGAATEFDLIHGSLLWLIRNRVIYTQDGT
jgi:hypothetical protein